MTARSRVTTGLSGGSNQARDILWEHTIYQVIRLLEEAEKRIRSAPGRARYTRMNGWWRSAKARLSHGQARIPSETALTEAVIAEIESFREEIILNSASVPPDLAGMDQLQFAPEVPRRRKKGIGQHAKPTDIRVYRLGSEIIDLRIEAKVIVKDGDIKRSYLSRSGLKRFSDREEPYTEHEVGGMLAYTLTEDRTAWLARIDKALCASVPAIPTFKHRILALPDDTLFCRVPFHAKGGGRTDVAVFHVVLEFDCDPPARA